MSEHHVRDEMIDVLLDDASQASAREVEQHLQSCDECRAAFDRLRLVGETVATAPLEPSPPEDLWDGIFVRIRHFRTAELLEAAPLVDEPDRGLVDRVFADERLEKVVSIETARRKRPPLVRGMLVAGAALLVLGLVFSVMRIAALNSKVDELEGEDSTIAVGHPVQTVDVSGDGIDSELELIHFRHDNYRLQLVTKDFPVQKPGHHYEVWLEGEGGATLAGSFRISRPDEVTFIFNVGIDPSEYTRVEVVEEPDQGPATRDGEVIAEGSIDPNHVDHGGQD